MEPSLVPEKPSPDKGPSPFTRPPGLEFAMGVSLFSVIMLIFFLVQSAVFVNCVIERTPELAEERFSFAMLDGQLMQERMAALMTNGDIVAQAALWSGLVGSFAILLSVFLWKRERSAHFLGLRSAHPNRFLIWAIAFIALGFIIEGLSYLLPAFRTDFMKDVIDSTTNVLWLYIGVGIMAPLFEELLLRGLLFGSMRHLVDEHAAVAITAGVFTLMHMQYTWTVMLLILPLGVVLGYARSRSGSIWVPIVLHMLNNLVSVALP